MSEQDDDGLINGYESKAIGTLVGLDRQYENALAGFAVGYARADIDSNNTNSKTELDALSAGLYVAYQPSDIKYEAGSVYTLGMSNFERETPLNSIAIAEDVFSHTFSNYIGASYKMSCKNEQISFTPNAKLAYTYFTQESYSESNAGDLGLNIDSFNNDIITATIGVKAEYQYNDQLVLNGLMSYKYDIVNDAPTVEASFQSLGSTPFETTGMDIDKSAIEIGAGYNYRLNDKLETFLDYSYEKRSDMQSHNLTLGLNLLF